MKAGSRATVSALVAIVALGPAAAAWSQAQQTVEESYLQSSIETMVIKEQAQSDTRDMKAVALQYAKQAIDEGRKNDDIRNSLQYLALETSLVEIRSGGTGRLLNDYPDIRAKACDYLADFPSPETKETLVKVALGDREPMVLSSAIRSLGKIGINDNDEVTQVISYLVNRFDVLQPDNSLAFECLVALERISDKTGGLKDPSAVRAIMKIASGNYITPVKLKANALLDKLRKSSPSGGK